MHSSLAPRLAVVAAATFCGAALFGGPALGADGDQDPTFGVAGVLGPQYNDTVRDAATLRNEDIAVVGDLAISGDPLVDWLDVTVDGHVIIECGESIPFLASFQGNAVIADRGGRLLVGGRATLSGSTSQDRALLVRYNLSGQCGSLDTTWSGNGWQLLDPEGLCASADCVLSDVAEAPTNAPNLFALVESRVNLFVSRYFVVAFLNDGSIDSGFGASGYAEAAVAGMGNLLGGGARLAIDSHGRPVVLATRSDPNQSADLDPVVFRFTAAGALDTSFGTGGVTVLHDDPDTDDVGGALAIAVDGGIFAVVNSISPDHTGWLFAPEQGGWGGIGHTGEPIADLVLQGDDKVLTVSNPTVGDAIEVNRIVHVGTGFASDQTFGDHGSGIYGVNFGGNNGQQAISMVLSGGRPLVLGSADTDGPDALFAIRIKNRYLLVDSFEVGSKSAWSASYH